MEASSSRAEACAGHRKQCPVRPDSAILRSRDIAVDLNLTYWCSTMQQRAFLSGLVFLCALPLSACSSSTDSSAKSLHYLGLGDSTAFGENSFVPFTKEARPNDTAFVGYPDLIGREDFAGQYANLGCSGATTDSFLSLTGEEGHGCREYQMEWPESMHVQYTNAEADKADEILRTNDVKLVTLSIGGNDLLNTLASCVKLTPDDADATLSCALKALPVALQKGAQNLATILQRIRDTGFKGSLVYVNLHSIYPRSDPATTAISAWNTAMAPVVSDAGGVVANAFDAFGDAAASSDGDPCTAGLLIPNPDPDPTAVPRCDVHPSTAGTRLLADTVKATPGYSR
jgi:hypothetical protein